MRRAADCARPQHTRNLDGLRAAFDDLQTRMPGLAAMAFGTPLDPEMANACRITLFDAIALATEKTVSEVTDPQASRTGFSRRT